MLGNGKRRVSRSSGQRMNRTAVDPAVTQERQDIVKM
jgi:hypothetical protein